MKHHLILGSVAVLILGACSGDSIPHTGSYKLDQKHFAPMLTDKLIEMGKFPASARSQVLAQLKSAQFNLDLAEDGTFTATQQIATDRRSYKGNWTLVGKTFILKQTHENDEEIEDEMTGTLVDGKLELTHTSDDGTMEMILYHEAVTAAAPR